VLLLGFDTATAVTSVGLMRSMPDVADHALGERSHVDPRRHGEVLPVFIDEVLRAAGVVPSDLDAIAVGIGPGAFTGLRVGLATAQAFGAALEIPVYGVSTLDVLAFATGRTDPFAVVTDARRREYFWATYSRYDSRAGEPAVGPPSAAREALQANAVLCPPGTPPLDGIDAQLCDQPSGLQLCRLVLSTLAAGKVLAAPVPLYLRLPDVMPAAPPKSVLS
jgi:tRNA threonylcarbamoyladenosine biosynthesis protein TsaB